MCLFNSAFPKRSDHVNFFPQNTISHPSPLPAPTSEIWGHKHSPEGLGTDVGRATLEHRPLPAPMTMTGHQWSPPEPLWSGRLPQAGWGGGNPQSEMGSSGINLPHFMSLLPTSQISSNAGFQSYKVVPTPRRKPFPWIPVPSRWLSPMNPYLFLLGA